MAPSILLDSPPSLALTPSLSSKQQISLEKKSCSTEPALLHRSLLETPYNAVSAAGSYLHLEDGRKILDGCGGAAVAIIGHANPEVINAATAQMQKVSYVHTLSYTTDSAEDLAHCILERRPGDFDHGLTKAFFVGSGSEANDSAMKCARQYWFEKGETQRKYYVARRQGYHGNTIGAMSISSVPGRKIPYGDILLPHVSFVSPADSYHNKLSSESEDDYTKRLVTEIEEEFLRLGPENIISFIAETVVGAALGSLAAPKGYWPSVRALCDKYGILLHLDEVMCGMGRTGTYFAFEQEGIRPDLVSIGKGLGGGYAPIGGMLINNKVVDGLRKGTSAFNHGHTYQAHPVTCATALAVQEILKRDGLVHRCAIKGILLEGMLRDAFAGCKYVGDIRGRGLFWTVEFVRDKSTRTPFERSQAFGYGVQHDAFELGVAVYPGAGTVDGVKGDHILIAPPYTVTDEELQIIVITVKQAYERRVARLEL